MECDDLSIKVYQVERAKGAVEWVSEKTAVAGHEKNHNDDDETSDDDHLLNTHLRL